MSHDNDKRHRLLGRLGRQLACTAPVLVLAAAGVSLQATMENESSDSGPSTLSLFLSSAHAEAQGEVEGEAQAEAEAEAQSEGEAEGEAEGEGEGEAEGEAEAAKADSREAVKRPEGYTPVYSEDGANDASLLAQGEALYYDDSLSSNGLACASCHGSDGEDVGYQATFEQPFPHRVAMADSRFGMPEVHADEMVQVCMVAPMEAEPLGWGSEALTSLAAYMVEVQRRFAGESHDL
ncbi:hypothetical protein [Halomonas marinisediminis]|uniref:Cytochrome c domain-containing protein n=1 Tax=Halomonas marinisediminis TaxID=2546095 RepID=A0ABY2D6K8_9GAMM|nr:hypothetical protein [Halomonas marinisediminis]TDB02477.1 hypothetical protein E0702_08980 [Halomonas marinisediminis]